MQLRSPINPPSKLGRRPPLDTVIYPFLRKTRGFLRETRCGSDYGSEGCRFNSYWVRHFHNFYKAPAHPCRAGFKSFVVVPRFNVQPAMIGSDRGLHVTWLSGTR